MASSNHLDRTFRNYSAEQAAQYAQARFTYPLELYETIMKFHGGSGGAFGTVLDVGCGPGNATRDVAKYFDNAYGADPGDAMIAQARKLNGKSKTGNDIEYVVAASEEVGDAEGLASGSVDLITSAMSAHWFHMDKFWPSAKKLLKVGGTVAIWTRASYYVHPATPHAEELQKLMSDVEDSVLRPYEAPTSKLSRGMYEDLLLPWQVKPPVSGFEETNGNFKRVEWNKDGKVEPGKDFLGGRNVTPAEIEMGFSTASTVTRWREANPDIANTDKDPVKVLVKEVVRILGSADVKIHAGASTALLLLKRIKD